jgi:tetratricopeptide (TPR) repeat protein
MRLVRPLAEVPIPGTIHEVVAARLDRLRPSAKRVLQVAAVLGRQFGRAELGALLADEGVDIDEELAELVRRGILHGKATREGDELRFGESVTQEIAYEGLLLRQRRVLHERVARFLDDQPAGGPERSALRAHHWSRSEDRGRAAAALLAAARDAENVPSYRAAAEFYRRAWEAAEAASGEFPDDRYLRMALEATSALGRLVVFFGLPFVDDAARAVERGRELAEYFHDTEATASLLYMLGVMKMTRADGDYAGGLAVAERGLALAQAKGLELASIRIGRGLCLNYTIDGRFAEARRWLDEVLPVLASKDDPARPADLHLSVRWSKDVLLYASDDLDAAVAHVEETLALGERAHNRTIRCIGGGILAQVHCLRGEYVEAKRLADESLAIGEEIGNLNVFPAAASIALLARVELGESVDPTYWVECIEKGVVAAGFMQLNVRFVTEALLAIGDVREAERYAVALWGAVGGRLRQGLVGVAYGDVMQRLGRGDEAARAYDTARALAEEIGSRSVLVGAVLGRSEVAIARGESLDVAAIDRARAIVADVGLRRYAGRLEQVTLAAMPAVAAS